MFYETSIDEKKLRFGDVLKGYLSIAPKIMKPFETNNTSRSSIKFEPYSIEVDAPEYCVVLDPCCDIGSGVISLSPLVEVSSHFWDIPCLLKNMTNLNLKGMPKDLMHPATWNNLSEEEKTDALNAVPEYGHRPYFVYEGIALFPEYSITREIQYNELVDPSTHLPEYQQIRTPITFKARHRMVNFKNIYHLNCQKIFASDKEADESVFKSIVVRLSVKTRNELRNKMAHYFGKIPAEDEE
jgi:hypothetical protein